MPASAKIIQFKEQISSLNHTQITSLVNLVLDKNKQDHKIQFSDEFQHYLNFWNEVHEKDIPFRAEEVEQTMDLFYATFRRDDFTNGRGFSTYLVSFIDSDRKRVADLMRRSCKILGVVQQKDSDSQNQFFQSFPPQLQDLQCLDGTLERVEIIERDLFARKDLELFVEAHKTAMQNAADFLKNDVYEGNQVHLIKYLEYTFGIGDQNSIHAQSQIPFYKSVELYQEYSQSFKYFLLKKFDAEIEETKKDIRQRIDFVEDIFDVSNPRYFVEVNSALKVLNSNGLNLFKEDEEENDRFVIDQDALKELAENHPAIGFFDSQEVQQTLARTKLITFLDEESQKYQQQQAELRKDFLSNPSQFFLIDSEEKFLSLINPRQQYPEMISDKMFAFDHLWMAGEYLLSAPNHFFVLVVRSLNESDPDFFEKSKIELTHFSPLICEKIDRIESNYRRLIQSSVYSDLSHIITMSEMINLGFPSEIVKSQIIELSRDNNREWYLLENAEENYQKQLMSALIARPDAEEVIDCLIENKIECEEERLFFGKLLGVVSKSSNIDLCRHLFEKLSHNLRYLEDSNFFYNITSKNRFELIPDIADFMDGNPQLITKEDLINAVKFGSVDFIKFYSEILAPTKSEYFQLCVAAISSNQFRSFKELISKEPDVINLKDSYDNNLLHHQAAKKRESFLVETYNVCQTVFPNWQDLLKEYAYSKNKSGITPFDVSVKLDDVEAIKVMMDKFGVDPLILDEHEFNQALKAMMNRKEKVVTEFVERGIYKEIYADAGGIIFALLKNKLKDEAVFLIECGEDINHCYQQNGGNTVLHAVMLSEDVEDKANIISLLISLGADLTIKNNEGLNPLQILLLKGSLEEQNAFIESFAKFFHEKNIERLQNFISAGLDPNIVDREGDILPHNFIRSVISGNLSEHDIYDKEIDNFINQFDNLGFDFTKRNHQGFTYDYPLLSNEYPTYLHSLPAQRFNFLFYEAILRKNLEGLELLCESSKIRTMGEQPTDSENIFCKNFNSYLDFARENKIGQNVVEFIENKALEFQIVRENNSEVKAIQNKSEPQNQTVRDFVLGSSNDEKVLPPSTEPIKSSSKHISQQNPSNDNSKSR